jgi:hypothetical protein
MEKIGGEVSRLRRPARTTQRMMGALGIDVVIDL